MSETEIKERLARLEEKIDGLVKKLDSDERHRTECYHRFDDIEEYIATQKGQNTERDKIFSKMVSVVTVINIITLLSLKLIFHV